VTNVKAFMDLLVVEYCQTRGSFDDFQLRWRISRGPEVTSKLSKTKSQNLESARKD